MQRSKEFTTKEARSVLLFATTFVLQCFTQIPELELLVSKGKIGVKVLPLLPGQSRGAEAPSGGVKELPVALEEADAVLEVEVEVEVEVKIRDELLGADDIPAALSVLELVDWGMLGNAELL